MKRVALLIVVAAMLVSCSTSSEVAAFGWASILCGVPLSLLAIAFVFGISLGGKL